MESWPARKDGSGGGDAAMEVRQCFPKTPTEAMHWRRAGGRGRTVGAIASPAVPIGKSFVRGRRD